MNKRIGIAASVLVGMLLVVLACKKIEQPEMANNNNCDCLNEVSAEFKVGQMFQDKFVELDTIHMYLGYYNGFPELLTNCFVNFSAKIENAISYEWQVGNNSIVQTDKDFGLFFSDTIGTIPVRLIVHSKTNKICFPDDDGIDTVVKNITIMTMPNPPLFGKYKGYHLDSPNEELVIEIDTAMIFENPNYTFLSIRNLPEGNHFDGLGEYNTISFLGIIPYGGEDGFFQYIGDTATGFYDKLSNTIEIKYSFKYINSNGNVEYQKLNRTFIGKKLN
jgi:hypothetical protein